MGQPAFDKAPAAAGLPEPCAELVLFKKDDIKTYAWFERWLLYFAYWFTGYDGEIQLQAICTSEEQARKIAESAAVGGYRAVWLPVDESLPEERCQWRPAIHFNSPFEERYKHYWPTMQAVPHKKLIAEIETVSEGISRLESITSS